MFKLNFPETPQEDMNRSAMVAKVVELVSLRMTKGEFGPSQETATRARKNVAALPPYQFEFTPRFDEKENLLEVEIVIHGRDIRNATGEGAGTDGLRVDAGFLLTYQLMVAPPPEDLRRDLFSAFARVNGLMNVWPYYREFAHEVARRIGFPAVLIPLLRVESIGAESKSEKTVPKKSSIAKKRKPQSIG